LEIKYILVLGSSLIGIGVLGGFYMYALLQNQVQVLIPATVVLVFLTWLGSGADFLGLLKEWYKDKIKEREKIESLPKLVINYHPEYPDTYCPSKPFVYPHPVGRRDRKYLRIAIENIGGSVARQCEAKLRVVTDNKDGTNPSLDPKILQWSTENITQQDIGVGSFSLLNIVFSVGRSAKEKYLSNKYAYVGTQKSLNETPRMEDGFNIGEYDFEVVIRAIDGTYVSGLYRLIVTDNWLELSIQKVG
jgi:hypothetical protein